MFHHRTKLLQTEAHATEQDCALYRFCSKWN